MLGESSATWSPIRRPMLGENSATWSPVRPIEALNLAQAENNQGGSTVVDVARQVSNWGSGNTYKIGASADSLNNGFGSKTVRLG